MANKDTIEKVKSLLEGHCYGPLREAAEKWLAVADEKYDVKDKAGKAWDKLNDAVDKVADASAKFNETMDKVSDSIGDKYDDLSEKTGPAFEKLAQVELVKQLKEGICSVGDLINTFGADDAAEKFGDDFATKMKAHAEELKEKGEAFCDCDACKKARSILKDFGEDIEAAFDKVEDAVEDKFKDKAE
ncbi:MAG: hypothetical protein IKE85_06720 [Mogibacterium sp.]|nr:hypothetical protein [Mogibacterium sp.]